MKLNATHYTVIALMVVSWVSYHYYAKYEKQLDANGKQLTQIQQLTDTVNYQQSHIEMLRELDTKHTQVLANANAEIDRLHTASLAHPERVYIKATCPVPKTLATAEQMIRGLQDYIQTECRRENP
ncbi:putative Rac prophage; prophage lambda endopeptidase [Xenorhabdus bovienii str. oregonense]|uniref:Putative Rac prophage prophage lambda endopeptidase n=1 Tax=Xenorhabdus bovienii str. oregonense TaxID=1398202 RepID=A0A077P2T0_XENBV|nr:lysis system i-spanin subunit Rz [Xenorhabdus bovienii]CDH05003.1 putative Rac prophage; prophage lambda endopeptidase [Xenorhabdus bovienii str. oregonense]